MTSVFSLIRFREFKGWRPRLLVLKTHMSDDEMKSKIVWEPLAVITTKGEGQKLSPEEPLMKLELGRHTGLTRKALTSRYQ